MQTVDVMLVETARSLPGVQQATTAAGTPRQAQRFEVNGRAFLFVGATKAYLRLGPSFPEAQAMAKTNPALQPGGAGWTHVHFSGELGGQLVPGSTLRRWVQESYDLVRAGPAPSFRVDLLDMRSRPAAPRDP